MLLSSGPAGLGPHGCASDTLPATQPEVELDSLRTSPLGS